MYVSFSISHNWLPIWKIKGSNSKCTKPIWNCRFYGEAGSILFIHGKFRPSPASGHRAMSRNRLGCTSRQKPHDQHESPTHRVCTQGWRQPFAITLRKSEEDIQVVKSYLSILFLQQFVCFEVHRISLQLSTMWNNLEFVILNVRSKHQVMVSMETHLALLQGKQKIIKAKKT